MPRSIHTPPEVQSCIDAGAQLVEVLPTSEYEEMHLPGALSLPLRDVDADASRVLDRTRAVVLYCWDAA